MSNISHKHRRYGIIAAMRYLKSTTPVRYDYTNIYTGDEVVHDFWDCESNLHTILTISLKDFTVNFYETE